jgi:DNA-binding CsgD family transcriptional regulator/tetratricopeptide (TPR) repeat protein
VSGELVGRALEVELVFSQLAPPARRATVLGGQAGIGKTRLAQEIADRWEAGGADVTWLSGSAGRTEIPFGAVVRLLPEVAAPSGDLVPAFDAQLIRSAVALARQQPDRLVVIDDAHLLDQWSALLIHHVVLDGQAPVLLTVRSGEPAPPTIAALWRDRRAERVDLLPLSRVEVADLATRLIGGDVEKATAERLCDACDGNPLLLTELIRDVQDSADLQPVDGRWRWDGRLRRPRRLVEFIGERLRIADVDTRRAVCILALAEPIGLTLLRRLVPGFDAQQAEDRGLVKVRADGHRMEIRLGHPLIGEAIIANERAVDWAELRVEVADEIAATGGRRAADKTFEAALRLDAGDRSRTALFVEVAEHLAVFGAPDLAQRMVDAAEAGGADLPTARLIRGMALASARRFAEAVDVLEAALPSVATDADRVKVFQALSHVCRMLDQPQRIDKAYEVARSLVADDIWRAVLDGTSIQHVMMSGRTKEATRRAEALLETQEDPRIRLRLVSTVGSGWAIAGRTDAALEFVQGMLPDALRLVDELPLAPAWVMNAQAMSLLLAGRLDDATSFIALLESILSGGRGGRHDDDAWLLLFSGRIGIAKGRAAEAADRLARAAAVFGDDDFAGFGRYARSLQAEALALTGDLEAARHAAREAELTRSRALVPEGDARRARCWVRALSGELTGAIDELLDLAALQRLEGQHAVEIHSLHDAFRIGANAEAGALLIEAAALVDGRWPEPYLLHVGASESGLGRDYEAAGHAFASMGALLLAAEAMAEAARAYEAEALPARSAGAARRRDELLAECGPVRTPALVDSPSRAGLTRREREVVEFAAAGLSNREIADRLFVSVRTAEGHLYRACQKLGVADRSELARVLGGVEIA